MHFIDLMPYFTLCVERLRKSMMMMMIRMWVMALLDVGARVGCGGSVGVVGGVGIGDVLCVEDGQVG